MRLKGAPLKCAAILLISLVFTAGSAFAQIQDANDSEPYVGQQGKDVIWLPSEQGLVDRMLDLAKVTPQDYVIDLGSGDGRTVITAARRGARALGIEYDPKLFALAKKNAESTGVSGRAQFINGDIFQSDFSQATVLTMFLLPSLNMKLRPTILEMKPGTRIVSNSFDMEDWEADQMANVGRDEGCQGGYCVARLWIVPAKVEGSWRLPDGELRITQTFQMLSG
ncbi:MAG: class I SAM-dependent methyltransferase, partial [Syntrophaceae bacterium]|nr:class I SAM-dependent methyltransferase [Syntrophaceae bacterium]